MNRDIRDPKEIGAALETQRAHSSSEPITALADKVLSDPTIRNYEESSTAYAERVAREQNHNRNGQIALFRAA